MAYDYLLTIDNDVLYMYINSIEDIEVYNIALNLILKIYEKREEYEKCFLIKNKIDEAKHVITVTIEKLNTNEST